MPANDRMTGDCMTSDDQMMPSGCINPDDAMPDDPMPGGTISRRN